MATLATKLSRVIVTKSSAIKQVLPLTNFSSTTEIRNNHSQHQQQQRMIGTSCRYDRAEQRQQTRNKNAFLLATNSWQQVEKARAFHYNHTQKRFLSVGGQNRVFQSATASDGADNNITHNYKTILINRPLKYVVSVELNRPKTKNAFSLETADEFVTLFRQLDDDPSVRCVVLSGNGPDFTSGVDIKSFMSVYGTLQEVEDVAHRARMLRSIVERFQAPFKSMNAFGKPIICVQHGLSLGLAMELAACSDIRFCSRDTRMAIREVLIGIAADVGSLQLMPRLSANQSLLNELIYSGRYITVDEALNELKFVSRVCDTKEQTLKAALKLATTIASRSPVAVQGSKRNVRFSRDQTFEVGLDYNAIWNSAMMQGGDVVKAISAIMSKQEDAVEYDDL